MGLLVTLHLISSNVYNSLNAPQKRGFSYIEVWMIGAQGVLDGSVNRIRFGNLTEKCVERNFFLQLSEYLAIDF